jgi:hypothetical protein
MGDVAEVALISGFFCAKLERGYELDQHGRAGGNRLMTDLGPHPYFTRYTSRVVVCQLFG